MGYHVIVTSDGQQIEHHFVEKFHELAALNITEDSIIYEGEEQWKPELVANSPRFKQLADVRMRSSILAEQLFKQQARQHRLIIEDINQDRESFRYYYGVAKEFERIKRGDFLIRNVRNIEIEVKCKKFFRLKGCKSDVFFIEKDHLEKHYNMQQLTRCPVIFAIYQRCATTERPLEQELYMMDVNYMRKYILENQVECKQRDWGSGYPIEIAACKKQFELIDLYQRGIIPPLK